MQSADPAGARGDVVAIVGPVVDVRFDAASMPALGHALHTVNERGETMTLETAQHVQTDVVCAIALASTEGLRVGVRVTDVGHGVAVPVGDALLGRMIAMLGRPLDGGAPIVGALRSIEQLIGLGAAASGA